MLFVPAERELQRQCNAAIHNLVRYAVSEERGGEVALGRWLIFAGVGLIVLGGTVMLLGKLNLPIGRLPGDVVYRSRQTTIYFPWVTCLIVSVVASVLLWLFNRR